MSRKYDLNKGETPDLGAIPDAIVRLVIPKLVSQGADIGRRLTPRGATGNMQKRVEGKVFSKGLGGAIKWGAPHSHLVNAGVAPHEVTLTQRRALKFVLHGKVLFRHVVRRHPGVKAQHFAERTERQVDALAQTILPGLADRAVGQVVN